VSVKFRNLEVSPSDPVERWGVEGIATALDRGGLAEWRRIARALNDEPYGKVAADVEQAVEVAEDRGLVEYMRMALERARSSDKQRLALKLREHVWRSGMSQAEVARRLGTSPSRLSTYLSGQVAPSAVFAEKLRELGERPVL